MRAHMTMNGALVPTCAVSTFSSTDSLNAFVNLHVSYVVAVLRPLMCGDRKFSSHDWVNELDTIGDHIANIAEIESHAQGSEQWRSFWVALLVDAADSEHALVSRIASYKNLGDGDKETETTTTRLSSTSRNTRVWQRFGANGTTTQILQCRSVAWWKHKMRVVFIDCTNRRCC